MDDFITCNSYKHNEFKMTHEFDEMFDGYDAEEIVEALFQTNEGVFTFHATWCFVAEPDTFKLCHNFVIEFRNWYNDRFEDE